MTMALPILLGLFLILLTVLVHAFGSSAWIRMMKNRFAADAENRGPSWGLSVLMSTALFLILLHLAEITLWALAYRLLPGMDVLDSFTEALYFSIVTYTTLGYGDITLTGSWRLFSGIEATGGILLFGWRTAMLFAAVQRVWRGMHTIPEDNP